MKYNYLVAASASLAVATTLGLPSIANAATFAGSQAISIAPSPTYWSNNLTFNKYSGSGILEEVRFTLTGNATTQLTFKAVTRTRVYGSAGAFIEAELPSLSGNPVILDVVPIDYFGSAQSQLTIDAGGELQVGPLSGTAQKISFFAMPGDNLQRFTGSDSFTIPINAFATLNLNTMGGNVTTIQSTIADATLMVEYYVKDASNSPVQKNTPEPASILGMLTFAILGFLGKKQPN